MIPNINTRNYSQKSNFMCGSNILQLLPFYVTTLNIPSITTTIQEISGRQGAIVNMSPTSITFGTLSLEVLLDEDYSVYKDIVSNVHVDVETGTFKNLYFDFWTEVTNDMGKSVLKIEYYNCLIENIGELSLAANDDTTEQVFSLDIKYDYFKIINTVLPTLRVN